MLNTRRVFRSFRPDHQTRMPWSRVNSLVDGIFGFSATVLMLRLAAPVYEEGELGAALVDQAPFYLLYALGFLQIVGTWSVLRRISQWTVGLDFYAMLCAFITLMMWATLPFTLDVLVEALGHDGDVASALRLMSLTLLVGMAAYTGLFWRLERCGCFREGLDPDVFAVVRFVSYTVVAWPLATLGLSYLSPWAAMSTYVGAILLSLVPLEVMSTEQYAAAHG